MTIYTTINERSARRLIDRLHADLRDLDLETVGANRQAKADELCAKTRAAILGLVTLSDRP